MNDLVFLATWTPFLLGGFLWNVVVTILAVTIGSSIGALLGTIRFRGSKVGTPLCTSLSKLFRNVPTLAFMFAVVFVLPREFEVGETLVAFPLWLKAALGLSPSVIGFMSESLLIARTNIAKGNPQAALLIIPTWGNSVLITYIASSTASLVGVNELMSRCNSLIAATDPTKMVAVYLYAAVIFAIGCMVWLALVKFVHNSGWVQSLPGKWATNRSNDE
jgi:polar amino acid transport system permease protein